MSNINYKVGIISDTHGLLRDEVVDILDSCDYIIHAGDIGSEEILNKLRKIAPLYIVRGNNDREKWANKLDDELYFNIGDFKFYLIHNKNDIKNNLNLEDIDIIVFGHSHKYLYEITDKNTWINPGSCGKKRFTLPLTLAILNIENESYNIEKIDLDNRRK